MLLRARVRAGLPGKKPTGGRPLDFFFFLSRSRARRWPCCTERAPLPHSPMPLSCVTRSPTGRDARPRHAEPCGSIIRPPCPVMCDTRAPATQPMPLSCVTRSPAGRDARPRHAEPRGSIIRPLCPVMCDTRSSCRAKPNGTAFQNRPAQHRYRALFLHGTRALAAQPHAPVTRDPQPYRARRTTPSRRTLRLHHTTPMPCHV